MLLRILKAIFVLIWGLAAIILGLIWKRREDSHACPLNHRVNSRRFSCPPSCCLLPDPCCCFGLFTCRIISEFWPDHRYAIFFPFHRWSEAAFCFLFFKSLFSSHFLLHWRTLAEGRDIFLPLVFWSGGEGMCKDRQVFDQKSLAGHASISALVLFPSCLFLPLHLRKICQSAFWEFKSTSVF